MRDTRSEKQVLQLFQQLQLFQMFQDFTFVNISEPAVLGWLIQELLLILSLFSMFSQR